ncbi:MAG TPA: protein kinase [Thermoanaerobaculia bacterium]|nr:protein kinase [Thermoanaerobaculia bacterium]
MLSKGTRLGPYEIVSAIEAGGMGSVYRARDARLSREVALKVLPVGSMNDEKLVRRFMLEARAAASLTHPNVVAIHDVGQAPVSIATPFGPETVELRYLVEEFVEGASLRKQLRAGRPPLPRLLDIAIGIARGLTAAHEKGLVHRDLKPENVLIDKNGTPKIADFGLVRWIYPDSAAPSGETLSGVDTLTKTGFVVGTVGYMSPEQARGDEIGPESDLFVFGILLYELATGTAPFARASIEDAFTAILKEKPPPLVECVPGLPAELSRLVARCLEKETRRRYAAATDVERDLLALQKKLSTEGTAKAVGVERPLAAAPAHRRERTAGLALAAAGAVLVAFAAGFLAGKKEKGPPPPSPFELSSAWVGEPLPAVAGAESPDEVVVSPDGRWLAIAVSSTGEGDVYLAARRGSGERKRLSSVENGGRAPAFDASGRHIVFSSSRLSQQAVVWDVEIDSGLSPKRLVDDAEEPALSPDDVHLAFVRRGEEGSELWIASRDGSSPRLLARGARSDWRYPSFLPDGKAVVFLDVNPGLDSLSGSARILRLSLQESNARPTPREGAPRLDPWGRPAVLGSGAILARAWGARSAVLLPPAGEPVRGAFGAALSALSASPDGRLVVTRGDAGPIVLWRRK